MLVDLRPQRPQRQDRQETLDHAGITVNKNGIPFDTEKITLGGGIRVGTPAVTTRGMKEEEMMEIADLIPRALAGRENEAELAKVREEVRNLTRRYPLPGLALGAPPAVYRGTNTWRPRNHPSGWDVVDRSGSLKFNEARAPPLISLRCTAWRVKKTSALEVPRRRHRGRTRRRGLARTDGVRPRADVAALQRAG